MKRFFVFAVVIVSAVLLAYCGSGQKAEICVPVFFASECASDAKGLNYVIHAGGILWGRDDSLVYRGYAGSNSLEGLEQCADAAELTDGEYTVELDFSFTSDGHLVCIHNWDSEYIKGAEDAMTLDEFLASRIYGKYTPVSLELLTDFMREHDKITVVADIKDDFDKSMEYLGAAAEDLADRFIVQIYSPDQYKTAVDAGFNRIAYTLYGLSDEAKLDADAHRVFARSHRLEWIAFDKILCEDSRFVGEMLETGVPLYVHTVNGDAEFYAEAGISGVYTDEVRRMDG